MNIEQFKNSVRGKNVAVIGIGISNTPLIEMRIYTVIIKKLWNCGLKMLT